MRAFPVQRGLRRSTAETRCKQFPFHCARDRFEGNPAAAEIAFFQVPAAKSADYWASLADCRMVSQSGLELVFQSGVAVRSPDRFVEWRSSDSVADHMPASAA